MKTKVINSIKLSALVLFMALIPSLTQAQEANTGGNYFSADWQFNAPLGNDFSSQASGWGINFELQHFFTPKISGGLFVAWHTNNEYVPRQTYTDGTTAVSTDAVNSLFQLPFGVAGKYTLLEGNIVPYVGLKLGALYSEQYSYLNTTTLSSNNWGFFFSPEIGITIYPMDNHLFGFNFSGYYGYGSNNEDAFQINGLNNAGFRLGVVVRL